VVSNDEIKRRLADKREGKKQIKQDLVGDGTPTSDEIKEKFKQRKIKENGSLGYLYCETCNGYYELSPGEALSDFESCQCGGKLKYLKTLDEIEE
jgi:hypothetical protein